MAVQVPSNASPWYKSSISNLPTKPFLTRLIPFATSTADDVILHLGAHKVQASMPGDQKKPLLVLVFWDNRRSSSCFRISDSSSAIPVLMSFAIRLAYEPFSAMKDFYLLATSSSAVVRNISSLQRRLASSFNSSSINSLHVNPSSSKLISLPHGLSRRGYQSSPTMGAYAHSSPFSWVLRNEPSSAPRFPAPIW